jgi:hypothetical protein
VKILKEAIYSKVVGDATLNGYISSRCYYGQAPNDPGTMTFPYIVFFFVSQVPAWGMGASGPVRPIEKVRVQFDLLSSTTTSDQAADMFVALAALFDRASLTVTGYTFMDSLREDSTLARDDVYWRYTVEYLLTMEATS